MFLYYMISNSYCYFKESTASYACGEKVFSDLWCLMNTLQLLDWALFEAFKFL